MIVTAPSSPVLHRTNGRILQTFAADWPSIHLGNVENFFACDQMHTRRVHIDTVDISGFCEFARLEPGLYLSVLDLDLPTRFDTRVVGEDLIEFNFRLSGGIFLHGSWGELSVDTPSTLLWYQPKGHNDVWEELGSGTSRRERSVTLYCAKRWLSHIVGETSDAGHAINNLLSASAGGPTYRVMSFMPETTSILQEIIDNSEEGALRLLSMKAKGYDLLSRALRALSVPERLANTERHFSAQDCANISEAKRILALEYVDPPQATRLARRVGINLNKLNAGLRQLHGTTAQQIVRERRLERARELLMTTEWQVSEVGYSIGYAHHSTFTAAFVDRFGVAPKHFVKARRRRAVR